MFVQWAYPDSRKLAWNINQPEKKTMKLFEETSNCSSHSVLIHIPRTLVTSDTDTSNVVTLSAFAEVEAQLLIFFNSRQDGVDLFPSHHGPVLSGELPVRLKNGFWSFAVGLANLGENICGFCRESNDDSSAVLTVQSLYWLSYLLLLKAIGYR